MTLSPKQFQQRVLRWFDQHGRHDLPWQQDINPYRIWLSEIMLQQTQVSTVIPYFQRFVQAFPDVHALADAGIDEVMHLWTGLGYYSRARNLHRTAGMVSRELKGVFPDDVTTLSELPGIGRSTAGAIVAIAHRKRASILDGNVKRVLARLHGVDGWPGNSQVANTLWALAEQYTPAKRVADYTQAMMDLGATLCTRSRPACARCPLADGCQGLASGEPQRFPGKKPKKTLPVKQTRMLIIRNASGEILLQQRPPSGIWGGLWSFPAIEDSAAPTAEQFCRQTLGLTVRETERWASYRHTFSHFHLEIEPVLLQLQSAETGQIKEQPPQLWYNLQQPATIGLSAPVKKLLTRLSPPALTGTPQQALALNL